jgi:hypothetical protein
MKAASAATSTKPGALRGSSESEGEVFMACTFGKRVAVQMLEM